MKAIEIIQKSKIYFEKALDFLPLVCYNTGVEFQGAFFCFVSTV
jgi:hypothetical protein